MKTLLFYGDPAEKNLTKLMRQYAKNQPGIGAITSTHIVLPHTALEILFIESDRLTHIMARPMVIFLKNECRLSTLHTLPQDSIVILNSENQSQREFFSKRGHTVITYGLSTMDSVTFSSRNEQKVVVCLQRSIVAVDGTILEPMEIPCLLPDPTQGMQMLALLTILITMNRLPFSESQEYFSLP